MGLYQKFPDTGVLQNNLLMSIVLRSEKGCETPALRNIGFAEESKITSWLLIKL